jgi:hypothetical protein
MKPLNATTREMRRDTRRFLREQIKQRPAREPPCTDDSKLVDYALGRRSFVSEKGFCGIAPPNARREIGLRYFRAEKLLL